MKRKTRNRLRLLAAHTTLICVCLFCLLPVLYIFSVSLRPSGGITSSSFALIPQNATWRNYETLFSQLPFMQWLGNSLLLSLIPMLVMLVVAVPAAYAFSRMRYKGRSAMLYLLFILNAFPAMLSMAAVFKLLRLFGLVNTHVGIVVLYTGAVMIFAIYNIKSYFDVLPIEIEEAARIDGASVFTTMVRVTLPLAAPTIVVTSLITFISSWNEYLFAMTFLLSESKYTISVGLYILQGNSYATNWPVFAAGTIVSTLPVAIVFLLCQRHMVSGLTTGSYR